MILERKIMLVDSSQENIILYSSYLGDYDVEPHSNFTVALTNYSTYPSKYLLVIASTRLQHPNGWSISGAEFAKRILNKTKTSILIIGHVTSEDYLDLNSRAYTFATMDTPIKKEALDYKLHYFGIRKK